MLLASDGERPGPSILQCAGRPPHGNVVWGPNVGSAKTEQLWARFQAFPERTSDHPRVPPVLMRMDEATVRSLPYSSVFVLAPPRSFLTEAPCTPQVRQGTPVLVVLAPGPGPREQAPLESCGWQVAEGEHVARDSPASLLLPFYRPVQVTRPCPSSKRMEEGNVKKYLKH